MERKSTMRLACILALVLPGLAEALEVEIQGVRVEPTAAGSTCVEIAGSYPGVRIEADAPGQKPRICYNSMRTNSISIANTTLVATAPGKQAVQVRFEHQFPPGINGKLSAKAKFQGFFATRDGVGVPTGDSLRVAAYFSQGSSRDTVGEALGFEVGSTVDSALFDYTARELYVAAGPRTLKADVRAVFNGQGHKLAFADKCVFALNSGMIPEDTKAPPDAPASQETLPDSLEKPLGQAGPGTSSVPALPAGGSASTAPR
jgi:hypothetical protein